MAASNGAYRRPFVLAIDVGSSSVKAALYDAEANMVEGTLSQSGHELHTDVAGAAVEWPDHVLHAVESAIDCVLKKVALLGDEMAGEIAAVGMDSMAMTIMPLDDGGRPLGPFYTYADSRARDEVAQLRELVDEDSVHQRTGCHQHTSYMPAQMLWLAKNQPELVRQARLWVDVGTYCHRRWFARDDIPMSIAAASWAGMLDVDRLTWDEELLSHLPLSVERLPTLAPDDSSHQGLSAAYADRWPALLDVPFFLTVPDGGAANVGSGCVGEDRVALTLGTSGAMRMVLESRPANIPKGLWAYNLADRTVLGGALTDAGSVYAWLRGNLRLPHDHAELERALAALEPAAHGLRVLPFLSGERSPGWASDATGVVQGIGVATSPVQIVQAWLEAVAYRFALIWGLLKPHASDDATIIGNGGAILNSPYWTQLMADVLVHPITMSAVPEAATRGSAILALKSLGIWSGLRDVEAPVALTYTPDAKRSAVYAREIQAQSELYDALVHGHL